MECSLFDQRTGETHVLGILAVELLDLLRGGPAPVSFLARALAERCEQEVSPEWIIKVSSMLSCMDVLEIVEPCP